MKNIGVLVSTGSVGTQTLDIVRMHPDKFNVVYVNDFDQDSCDTYKNYYNLYYIFENTFGGVLCNCFHNRFSIIKMYFCIIP